VMLRHCHFSPASEMTSMFIPAIRIVFPIIFPTDTPRHLSNSAQDSTDQSTRRKTKARSRILSGRCGRQCTPFAQRSSKPSKQGPECQASNRGAANSSTALLVTRNAGPLLGPLWQGIRTYA
jgi:hypothetical protein